MSRYIYGKSRRNWNDPSSKFGLEPEKFDEAVRGHAERLAEKKRRIAELVRAEMTADPARQDQTLQLFVEVLTDWKREAVK